VFQLMQQIQHRVPRHNTDHMVLFCSCESIATNYRAF